MWSVNSPPFASELQLPSAFELTDFTPGMVKSFAKYLHKLEYMNVPICAIQINSYGGDACCLSAVMSLMSEYRKKGIKFCGVVPGFAFSAGALVFLFCDEGFKFMGDSASLMLHQVQLSHGSDRLSSIKSYADSTHGFQKETFEKISRHLKKKKDWMTKELVKKGEDWYISAKEAQEMGLSQVGLPTFNLTLRAEFSVL